MKKLFCALMVIAAMTACTNDEDFVSIPSANEIKVTATIGQMTRVATNGNSSVFESGDQIMVYGWTGTDTHVPDNPPIVSVNTYDGINWKAESQMLWQSETAKHYFVGIYPTRTVADFEHDTFVLDENDQEASDLLIAKSDRQGIIASNNQVPLEFIHLMAKLHINLNFRNQWETTPSAVKLYCSKEAEVGYWDRTVKAYSNDKNNPSFIQMPEVSAGSYASVVIPQYDVNCVDIIIDGTTYRYTGVESIPLECSKVTTLNLNVGKDGVTLGGVTVGDWTNGTTIPGGEAEEVPAYTTSEAGGVTTYTVNTAEGLQAVNEILVAQTGDVYDNITLARDIDLTTATTDESGSNWTPIDQYSGTFDGNGKTITGLTIKSSSDNQGLVNRLSGGTIKNLTLTNCTVSGGSYVGAFAAFNKASTNMSRISGTISGCILNGTSRISGTGNYVGGIAGYNLVGDGFGGTITGCTVSGSVTIKGNSYIGGITGCNTDSVTACLVHEANIQGSSNLAGIVGYEGYGSISGCYAYKCTKGENKDSFDSNANIYGTNENGTFTQCYYTTAEATPAFGNVGGSASDWSSAMSAMNGAISGWKWGGSADNPTLTKQ